MGPTFLSALAATLADLGGKATLLLLVAALATLALRRASASQRHLAWGSALVGVLVLPLVALVPGLPRLPLPAWAAAETSAPAARAVEAPPASAIPADEAVATPDAATDPPSLALPAALAGTPGPRFAAPFREARPRGTLPDASALIAVWGLGVLVALARLGAALVRRHRLAADASPLADDGWDELLGRLRTELAIDRPVRLLIGRRGEVPMTWGAFRPTILLPSDARRWTRPRRRTVLLHELAHVHRGDAPLQTMAGVATALLWFHPLAWIAARRLRFEAELASDDLVLASGPRPSLYAGHLLEAARDLRGAAPAPLTAVAMARPSQLSARIEAVLDRQRAHRPLGRRGRIAGLGLAVLVVAPIAALAPPRTGPELPTREVETPATPSATETSSRSAQWTWATAPAPPTPPTPPAPPAPASVPSVPSVAPAAPPAPPAMPSVPAPPAPPAGGPAWGRGTDARWHVTSDEGPFSAARYRGLCEPGLLDRKGSSTRIDANDESWSIDVRQGSCRLQMELEGEVTFAPGERGIAQMSRDSRFEVVEEAGGTRALVAVPDPAGRPRYTVDVEGERRSFGPEEERWLAELLPTLFRTTGLDAERRVDRILGEGGVPAVLAEIRLIPGDFVQTLYFRELLARHRPSAPELAAILDEAGRQIGSDHDLAELLVPLAESGLPEVAVPSFLAAASTLGSDFDHARALTAAATARGGSPALARGALAQVRAIGSDHDAAETLVAGLNALPAGKPVPVELFEAAAGIGSDYDLARVLQTALARPIDAASRDRLFATVAEIGSDHDAAETLMAAARISKNAGLPPSFFAAAATIGSDYDLARVLETVVARAVLDDATALGVLQTARTIGSDGDLARVLLRLADRHGISPSLRPAWEAAVASIGSRSERERVSAAAR